MMTMKRSISLSNTADEKLAKLSNLTGSKPSDVVEAALLHFCSLKDIDIKRTVTQAVVAKKVSTPSGWRGLFWKLLAETLGYNDFVYDSRRPYGPIHFKGCQVVFLLSNVNGNEDGTLTVHIMEAVRFDSKTFKQPETTTNVYRLEDSVAQAVNDAATWIKSHGDARIV